MAIILVLILNLSELVWLPFCDYPWLEINGYAYSLGDILYSFINQLGYISLLPSILLYRLTTNLESKGIYLGIIVWNCIEMIQEFDLLLMINSNFLIKIENTQATILQIIFINFTVILMYFGYRKWHTRFP